ncbi:MAG: RloB family protein [Gammaproteobacteria bacterium]
MRQTQDIIRRAASRKPSEFIVIFCEGETEVNYFKSLCLKFRLTSIKVCLSKGSAPISVVEQAIEFAQQNEGIDQIWCVIDRDEHASFDAAVNKLQQYKPNRKDKSKLKFCLAVSIPCFELWYLLHFCFTTKVFLCSGNDSACDNLVSELKTEFKKLSLEYKKTDTGFLPLLHLRTEMAIKNAHQLQQHNEKTGTVNPSTNLHELVSMLRKLGR